MCALINETPRNITSVSYQYQKGIVDYVVNSTDFTPLSGLGIKVSPGDVGGGTFIAADPGRAAEKHVTLAADVILLKSIVTLRVSTHRYDTRMKGCCVKAS